LRRVWILGAVFIALALGVSGVSNRTSSGAGAPVARGSASVTATVDINPLKVRLDLGASSAFSGTKISAAAVVSNHVRTINLLGVTAGIGTVAQLVVRPAGLRRLGRLPPGTSTTATWTICATAAGTYAIVAYAEGNDRGGEQFVAYSPARLLVVTPGRKKSC
jgi:hypothetical protein